MHACHICQAFGKLLTSDVFYLGRVSYIKGASDALSVTIIKLLQVAVFCFGLSRQSACLEGSLRSVLVGVLRRLHKLQQKHEQRVAVAQRARAAAEDEVVWDDDPRSPSPAASPRPARIGVPSPAKVTTIAFLLLMLGFKDSILDLLV